MDIGREDPSRIGENEIATPSRCRAHLLADELSSAIRVLCRVLAADSPHTSLPTSARSRLLGNRAYAYLELDMWRRCLEDCELALALDSDDIRLYTFKARAQHRLGLCKEAERTAREGLLRIGDIQEHCRLLQLIETWKISSRTEVCTQLRTQRNSSVTTTASEPPRIEGNQLTNRTPAATTTSTTSSSSAANTRSHTEIVGEPSQSIVAAAARMVKHGVGVTEIDERIALGYLKVNTGRLHEGIRMFTELITAHPNLVAAYLGRGTAHAIQGRFTEAIRDFSVALRVDPECSEGWKRRGQTRAALGDLKEALHDLNQAATLQPDLEVYHQRGLVFFKLKDYRRAAKDFRAVTALDASHKLSWNHLGLCLNALGDSSAALASYRRALEIDPEFKEAYSNMAQSYKDYGDYTQAEKFFNKALSYDPKFVAALHLRSLAHYSVGAHQAALKDLKSVLKINPQHGECRHMYAVTLHSIGQFRKATRHYVLAYKESKKKNYLAWYQLQVALWVHHHLDTPWCEFNIDRTLDPYFKEGWCKRLAPDSLTSYPEQAPLSAQIADVSPDQMSATARSLLATAQPYGELLQLRCRGYLPNRRQHRMAGLAILEMAQALRLCWRQTPVGASDRVPPTPLRVPDQRASLTAEAHPFGWRDLFDIAVRWRQISEPNDPVWWVDLLSPEQFREGFGSHTPMITGQSRVVRYYPMFERSFALMKRLIPAQLGLADDLLDSVRSSKSCADLYEVVGQDFWVVTPCASTQLPGKTLEGTRLTLQYSPPDGFEYSIRTPGTPDRWKDYARELDHAWDILCREARAPPKSGASTRPRCVEHVLTLAFYWYNFMPLSRGTAACGLISIVAMLLALDLELSDNLPEEIQPDWDAILEASPERYVEKCQSWLQSRLQPATLDLDSLPALSDVFPNYRKMMEVLNCK